MRLTDVEKSSIVRAIKKTDPSAQIYLFGSRGQDSLRGGDIDLLVVSEKISFSDKIDLLVAIKSEIGEQKIDMIIRKSAEIRDDPFVQSIRNTMIELV
jgi:predicted nucleotidyltransferase